MNATHCIDALTNFPATLCSIIDPLDGPTLVRRGADRAWSIVEILCHLADEEVEDFRVRLELTLSDPRCDWPGIDPQGAARSRDYQAQDPREALGRFVAAREANLRWLGSLDQPDWSAEHIHPRLGRLRAGDLLASWAAHDLLHLRQITKRLFESVQTETQPYSTAYAGEWTG